MVATRLWNFFHPILTEHEIILLIYVKMPTILLHFNIDEQNEIAFLSWVENAKKFCNLKVW